MKVDLYLSIHEEDERRETEEHAFGEGWAHFIKSANLPVIPNIPNWDITSGDDHCGMRVDKVKIDLNGIIRIFLTLPGFTADTKRGYLKKNGWREVAFWDTEFYDTPEAIQEALI